MIAQQQLILASASPRRRALLASLGVDFRVETGAALEETAILAEAYAAYGKSPGQPLPLEQLALAKGAGLILRYPEALVLSADTEVFIDAQLDGPNAEGHLPREHLGKPADRAAAIAMLSQLSGRLQRVDTALALQCGATGLRLYGNESTYVRFRELSLDEITEYVEREQPYDKAGGYAVQEIGDIFVAELRGEYSNVVGLPLELTKRLLREAGFTL